jgi:predicted RNase H-like nuclease (RuvC/YqgF family)
VVTSKVILIEPITITVLNVGKYIYKMKEIVVTVITLFFSSLVGYIFGYKKNKASIESDRLDNLEKSIRVYNTIIEDMSKKIEELTKEIVKLENRVEDLMKENKSLKSKKYEGL